MTWTLVSKCSSAEEIWLAVVDFLALGLIRRRRTVQHWRDETVMQPQIVVTMRGGGPIGKPVRVYGAIEPCPAVVARQRAPGAVANVGCRRQPEDEPPGLRVATTRYRPGPRGLMPKTAHFLLGHLLLVVDEARPRLTCHDTVLTLGDGRCWEA